MESKSNAKKKTTSGTTGHVYSQRLPQEGREGWENNPDGERQNGDKQRTEKV